MMVRAHVAYSTYVERREKGIVSRIGRCMHVVGRDVYRGRWKPPLRIEHRDEGCTRVIYFSSDLFLFFLERDLVGALELKERTNFDVYSVMMMMMMMALITGKFDERD